MKMGITPHPKIHFGQLFYSCRLRNIISMFYRVGIFLDTWEFKILKAVVKSYKYTYDNCTHHMSIFKASLLRKANFFSFFFFYRNGVVGLKDQDVIFIWPLPTQTIPTWLNLLGIELLLVQLWGAVSRYISCDTTTRHQHHVFCNWTDYADWVM